MSAAGLGRLATAVLRPLRNWSLRSAEVNVVVGEGMATRLQTLGVPPEKIKVIGNWADQRADLSPPRRGKRAPPRMDPRRPLRGGLRRQSRSCPRHRHGARGDDPAAGAREKVALAISRPRSCSCLSAAAPNAPALSVRRSSEASAIFG